MSNKNFLRVIAEREISDSEVLEIAEKIIGKSRQEKDRVLEMYAERIEKYNPLREHPLKLK